MYVWATSSCVGCDRVLVGLTVGSVMGRVGRQGEGGGRRAGRERYGYDSAPHTACTTTRPSPWGARMRGVWPGPRG